MALLESGEGLSGVKIDAGDKVILLFPVPVVYMLALEPPILR